MAEIEENTKADDKAQEEDYNEQEKELIKELAELCKREEEKALRRSSLPEETKKEDTEKEDTKKEDTKKEETEMEETEKGDTEMKETEEDDFVDLEKELKELKEGLSRRTWKETEKQSVRVFTWWSVVIEPIQSELLIIL